ncbi:MAG TPA: class I SAM-dependent methyltransferase [Mycobacterium sp.]|nr:class I SAM-dependent methyltransferase [Mycobacterium sp.]
MPRTDDDSWDITESVGSTALGVAAARAAETESERPLIKDPFARVFLEAAGQGMWTLFSSRKLPDELTDVDPRLRARLHGMVDLMAARTAFFDEFFLSAADAGVRQIVILAAGLDSRAWRLPWPAGTVVYELDQPKVLEFKSTTLRQHGAQPTARQVSVGIDLRQDWPTALQQAGFDPSVPTAWSAEGLLRFLPAAAQDLLFERIDALSPPGSRLAANAPASEPPDSAELQQQRDEMVRVREIAARLFDTNMPNLQELWYIEKRTDLVDWLSAHGWTASQETASELVARYGRTLPDASDAALRSNLFVSAHRLH